MAEPKHMAYFIDLFSPETYEAFARSPRDISGFGVYHKNKAEKIKPGDMFVCYLTRVCRWFGLLEVIEGPFIDSTPRFVAENDPFVVRFRVRSRDGKRNSMLLTRLARSCTVNHGFRPFLARSVPTLFPFF